MAVDPRTGTDTLNPVSKDQSGSAGPLGGGVMADAARAAGMATGSPFTASQAGSPFANAGAGAAPPPSPGPWQNPTYQAAGPGLAPGGFVGGGVVDPNTSPDRLSLSYGDASKSPWLLYGNAGNLTPWGQSAQIVPTAQGWRPLFTDPGHSDMWQNYYLNSAGTDPTKTWWAQGQQYRGAQAGDQVAGVGTIQGQDAATGNYQAGGDQNGLGASYYAQYYMPKVGMGALPTPGYVDAQGKPVTTATDATGKQTFTDATGKNLAIDPKTGLPAGVTQKAPIQGAAPNTIADLYAQNPNGAQPAKGVQPGLNNQTGKFDVLPTGWAVDSASPVQGQLQSGQQVVMGPNNERYVLDTNSGGIAGYVQGNRIIANIFTPQTNPSGTGSTPPPAGGSGPGPTPPPPAPAPAPPPPPAPTPTPMPVPGPSPASSFQVRPPGPDHMTQALPPMASAGGPMPTGTQVGSLPAQAGGLPGQPAPPVGTLPGQPTPPGLQPLPGGGWQGTPVGSLPMSPLMQAAQAYAPSAASAAPATGAPSGPAYYPPPGYAPDLSRLRALLGIPDPAAQAQAQGPHPTAPAPPGIDPAAWAAALAQSQAGNVGPLRALLMAHPAAVQAAAQPGTTNVGGGSPSSSGNSNAFSGNTPSASSILGMASALMGGVGLAAPGAAAVLGSISPALAQAYGYAGTLNSAVNTAAPNDVTSAIGKGLALTSGNPGAIANAAASLTGGVPSLDNAVAGANPGAMLAGLGGFYSAPGAVGNVGVVGTVNADGSITGLGLSPSLGLGRGGNGPTLGTGQDLTATIAGQMNVSPAEAQAALAQAAQLSGVVGQQAAFEVGQNGQITVNSIHGQTALSNLEQGKTIDTHGMINSLGNAQMGTLGTLGNGSPGMSLGAGFAIDLTTGVITNALGEGTGQSLFGGNQNDSGNANQGVNAALSAQRGGERGGFPAPPAPDPNLDIDPNDPTEGNTSDTGNSSSAAAAAADASAGGSGAASGGATV